MLESLFSKLAAPTPTPQVKKVPPVPPLENMREPLQATDYGAVPLVPPVPSLKTKVKTKNEAELSELIEKRAANDTRAPFDDRHYCHECQRLINGRCITQRFRPVDDRPRRCGDFMSHV
jgi:hypothetical protein